MRRLLILGTLALLALPAHAAAASTPPFLATLAQGDLDLGLPLQNIRAVVGYIDGNNNGHPDAATPEEMVYLDLDGSGSVTYGDLRLTAFDTYPAGTVVELVHHDIGRGLATANGAWFAQAGTTWYLDVDDSGAVSVGDLRFEAAPTRVHQGDAAVGTALTRPSGAQTGALGWTGSGRRDPELAFYADLDVFSNGGGRTSPGDLRITPIQPTLADARLDGTPAGVSPAAATAGTSSGFMAWRTLDWFVVGLAVLNLAGLVAITRQLNQLKMPPKNPFK